MCLLDALAAIFPLIFCEHFCRTKGSSYGTQGCSAYRALPAWQRCSRSWQRRYTLCKVARLCLTFDMFVFASEVVPSSHRDASAEGRRAATDMLRPHVSQTHARGPRFNWLATAPASRRSAGPAISSYRRTPLGCSGSARSVSRHPHATVNMPPHTCSTQRPTVRVLNTSPSQRPARDSPAPFSTLKCAASHDTSRHVRIFRSPACPAHSEPPPIDSQPGHRAGTLPPKQLLSYHAKQRWSASAVKIIVRGHHCAPLCSTSAAETAP